MNKILRYSLAVISKELKAQMILFFAMSGLFFAINFTTPASAGIIKLLL
jgi:hypothetical protein